MKKDTSRVNANIIVFSYSYAHLNTEIKKIQLTKIKLMTEGEEFIPKIFVLKSATIMIVFRTESLKTKVFGIFVNFYFWVHIQIFFVYSYHLEEVNTSWHFLLKTILPSS